MVNFKKILIFVALLALLNSVYAADCAKNKYYLLDFKYANGDVNYVDGAIETGCPSGENKIGDYNIALLKEKELVYSSRFNPGILYTDALESEIVAGGKVVLDETEFSLAVPYNEDVDKISVLKDGSEILAINQAQIQIIKNKSPQRLGLFDWVDLQMRKALALFS